jgi:hypothetical protein
MDVEVSLLDELRHIGNVLKAACNKNKRGTGATKGTEVIVPYMGAAANNTQRQRKGYGSKADRKKRKREKKKSKNANAITTEATERDKYITMIKEWLTNKHFPSKPSPLKHGSACKKCLMCVTCSSKWYSSYHKFPLAGLQETLDEKRERKRLPPIHNLSAVGS